MELWFLAAVAAAILAGLSNMYFKTAAARGYPAEIFSFYGSVITLFLIVTVYVAFPSPVFAQSLVGLIVFLGGFIAAVGGILKVYALRHIDTTIYFPLFKLLAPAIAIILGVVWFGERFTWYEWSGMLVGLLVPLLLITKAENTRQNNLVVGLLFVIITGVVSAFAAASQKFGIDSGLSIVVTFLFMTLGLLLGNLVSICWKRRSILLFQYVAENTTKAIVWAGVMRAVLISASVGLTMYGYWLGGPLAIMQTIHSMYILIPIVLSIIFYNEHWNAQKVVAIMLSVASLALLG